MGDGLVARTVDLRDDVVVWVRSLLEANEGLGFLYGDGDGGVWIVTTASQTDELDAFLAELVREAPAHAVRLRTP